MKAAVLRKIGSPFEIEEIKKPSPKSGEVLVKVSACGVCHTDLHVIKGEVKFPTPAVLGHEISGVIDSVGPGVESLAPGDHVSCSFIMPCGDCYFCVRGRDDLCEKFFQFNRLQGKAYDGNTRLFSRDGSPIWMYSMGGLAEFAIVPKTAVFKISPSIPLDEASILGCAIFTSYGAVKNQAVLRAGETVAVVAVGGVGLNIIQIARISGASQIIAIDVREDKLQAAKGQGATHLINSKVSNVVEEVLRITEGKGVDVAFEALGRPETVVSAFNIAKDGGRVVVVGIAPAGVVAGIDITRLVRRGIRICGSYGARARTDMPEILKLAERGMIDLTNVITRKYSLDEVNEGYSALSRGEIVGRAIIRIS